MKVIHENKFAQAYYDAENKIIWFRYIDLMNTELFIACHRAVMEFVTSHSVIACFYDLTKSKGTFTKVLNFLINEYEPALFKNNVKYGCFAMNEKDVFLKFAMTQMFKIMPTKIELTVHRETGNAVAWLEDKMKTKIIKPELPKNSLTA